MSSLFKIHDMLDFVCICVYVDMDTSWIDLRNDDSAFYKGCKAFVELAKETSIEGNTRCPCNKCKLNKWFSLEEVRGHILFNGLLKSYRKWIFHLREDDRSNKHRHFKGQDKEKEADLDDMGGLLREALGVHNSQSALESEGYVSDSNNELKPALDEFISKKWKENQFEQSRVFQNIENEWTINEYADWLRNQAHNLDDSTVEGKLRKALAGGLSSQAMAMKSVFINGYKFDIIDRERCRKTQNSGIMVEVDNQEFYGKLKSIYELDYYGSYKAIDIWNNNGVRYYAQFNELFQPIRKGGQLLVKLIGSIAKQERFCLVGELDCHHIDKVHFADMINEIRDRFVIPDGEIYINKILSRIAKAWRQYKSHLKSVYFKPQERSQEEHYNAMPGGISRDNWRKLVKFWFSEKGQEDKNGEEMSLVQLYEDVHIRKDGSFIEGTDTQDFLRIVDGSKSRKEVEDEVFESLMYGGELPKRPQGFGFGVVKSTIYGVHGLLRKEGHGKVHKRPLENENVNLTMSKNVELVKRNEVLEETVNQNTMLLMSLLEAMRNGKPSTELIDAAQSSLRKANSKVSTPCNVCR
ncbi:Inhibitory regulator protein IRA2 [Bienertia sinuspersici]